MSDLQAGRIPCPSCQAPILLEVEAVLDGSSIVCGGCGLELKTNPATSRAALDALGQWYEDTRDARDRAAPTGTGEAMPQARRARHTRRARGRRPRR